MINGVTSAAIPIRDYVGNDYMGFMHTHPCACYGWNPMFSAGDINSLFFIAQFHNNNGQPKNHAEYFVTLTIPQGTYAIKVKDWQKFVIARNQKWNKNGDDLGIAETLEVDKYFNRDPEGDIKYYEKDILDVFKKYDMGVGLYKANDDLTEWSELVHDLDPLSPNFGYAKEKPCNENNN